jgi:hypothetical protein
LYRTTDSTEPIDNKKKKIFYSGKKKKRHTVKNQFMVNNRGYILHKVNHKKGRRHDYDVYKKNRHLIPKQVVNVLVLGYLGVEKDFPEQLSALPYKRKRNPQELSAEQEKEYNQYHSKKRIVIESITLSVD